MKYSIYIRGRGWAFQLADSLNKKNNLKYLVTSYPKFYVKKYKIPNNKIRSVFFLEIFVRLLRKFNKFLNKFKIDLHPTLIVDLIADYIFSIFYISNAEVYIIGFGNSSCKIINKSKKNNVKTIYFLNNSSPSCRAKLKDEYKKYDVLKYFKKEEEYLTKRINNNIKNADYVGCISTFQRDSYIKDGILDRNKALTTIMGVDTSIFYPKKLNKDKFVVIGVGNDFVRKGFKYLIDGFNSLKLENSELWLVGNLDKKLISKITNLQKNNLIIDSVNEFDLPEYYNKCSVFCLPTLEEGAPAVISQAMACGLPIITTKNCQGPDVIDNGKNGFIVEEMNSKSIGDSIDFFYKNPNKTIAMGDAAANYAKEKLSYDFMTKNITDFFDNINKK